VNAEIRRILRRNLEELEPSRRAGEALYEGTLAELAKFASGDDPAAAFREISDMPLCSAEFARFCRMTAGGITDPLILAKFLPDQSAAEDIPSDTRTAYLRNAYTDRAFAAFSREIHRLSAQYQTSFSAGCEEVYYGRCSYCILPIRNSEDGTLSSFTRMITKYDLKIARVCDITTQDGDSTMRYALLRRGLDLHAPQDGFLQTTLLLPGAVSIGTFLHAAEYTGASAENIATIPLQYTSDRTSLNITFRINRESTAPLLLFLGAVTESCTTDGIYTLHGA